MKTPKTPQEKKELSYQKDRRNNYGENDKASRKAIPFRKRLVNRQNRKQASDAIAEIEKSTADESSILDSESKLLGQREKKWKKVPDVPLSERIEHSPKWRIFREGRKESGTLNTEDPRLNQ